MNFSGSELFHMKARAFLKYFVGACRKVGPGSWDVYKGGGEMGRGEGGKTREQDPKMSRWVPGQGTPKVRPGTWFTKIFKRDPGLGTPKVGPRTVTTKYLSEIRGFQFSVALIVYSTFNTIHVPCYKTLHYSVYEANLFHGEYVEVATTMC